MSLQTFYAGQTAILDARYLIPCKVLKVIEPYNGVNVTTGEVEIQITESGKGYTKGEILTKPAYYVVPKTCLVTRNGHYRITPYKWN